jgi:hypothetical protein
LIEIKFAEVALWCAATRAAIGTGPGGDLMEVASAKAHRCTCTIVPSE